jgi:ABC-type transport system involved in cytochrome c biogenesis ATPase subunit
VQIMGNGYLSLLAMVAAIVTAAEGAIKRNNHNKHMQSDTAIRLQFAWC